MFPIKKNCKNENLSAGNTTTHYDYAMHTESSGFLSSSSTTIRNTSDTTTAVGVNLGATNITLDAKHDLNLSSTNVLADKDISLTAGNNINLLAAQNTSNQTNFYQHTESGLLSGGGLGITIGSRKQTTTGDGTQTSAVATTIGSIGGNISINAGNVFTQKGSDIIATGIDASGNQIANSGNIDIHAKSVDISSQTQSADNHSKTTFEQTGLTLSISSPVISAIQTVQNLGRAFDRVQDNRMKILAAATAVSTGYNTINTLQQAQADKVNVMGDDGKVVMDGDKPKTTDANAADKAGGISISLSFGSSSSSSTQSSESTSERGSSLKGAGNIDIQANTTSNTALTPDTGNITIQGSTVQAGKTLSLDAQNKINILSSQDTSKERSSEESSSGSVGIGASLGAGGGGVGFTASASRSQGQGNGDSVTQNNSQLQGQTVTLKSGSDTVIQGGVIKADTVKADIGGNLTITSVQDTDTYHADSQNVSASVTIGAGASGSVGLGKSRTNSDYASVTEQSGIKTGDGGFDLKIGGSTTLTGGVISTTDAGIKAGNNKIATTEIKTSDIQNSANYDSQSWQLNIGSSAGASSAGYGSASGNASSTTQAGISGIAGNTAARTGDKETGIAKIFNQVQVKEDVDAQVTITTEAGRQIPKTTATFADKQKADLLQKAADAAINGDKATSNAYVEEAAKWGEGGSYRTAIHTAFGALSGGVGGAVGAGVVAANADTLNQMQDSFTQTLKDAGVNESVAKAIGNVTFNTAAIGIGSAVGGATGATTALNVDSNNRQLHPAETLWITKNSKKFAEKLSAKQERVRGLTSEVQHNQA